MIKTIEIRFPDEVLSNSQLSCMTARAIVAEAERRGIAVRTGYDHRTKEEVFYLTGQASELTLAMEAGKPKQLVQGARDGK
jgi:hypothetical protein